jgi:Zn-dependent protease with chaperone function
MNAALILGIVLLATFGLVALLLAGLVATAWHAGLSRARLASADVLALRLFPVVGALVFAVAVVLPAFLRFEPHQDREAAGPLLQCLAAFALLTLGHGIWRGWRAWAAARSLLQQCCRAKRWVSENGQRVRVVDVADPVVGVIGSWRPQVVAAECIIAACSSDEFRQVVAHEAAHISARDNLKLLLLLACPDALAWTALGRALSERWRSAAEFAADQHATGDDPHKRIALASALVKVARLFHTRQGARLALTMSVALDNVEDRVRQLLAPPHVVSGTISKLLPTFALVMPVVVLPLYAFIHELIEALVRFGL